MQQVSVLAHLRSVRARVVSVDGHAGFNHSAYDLLCNFASEATVQNFGEASPTLVLPDFLHALVLKGRWRHMMMQGSSVAVKGIPRPQTCRRIGSHGQHHEFSPSCLAVGEACISWSTAIHVWRRVSWPSLSHIQ